jgi:predicted DNA-binding transcriptional regulator YafY
MQDLRKKLKRQIEIVGLILSQNYSGKIRSEDLAQTFNVEVLTIARDLSELRSIGIDIHSTKKYGICIHKKIPNSKLSELVQQYASLSQISSFADKTTELLVNRLGEKSLANYVIIQLAIENKKTVKIDYQKNNGMLNFGREIRPILIFERDNSKRVLSYYNGSFRQFHLNKILEARITENTFVEFDNELLKSLFQYSWKSWLSKDKFNVKLKFLKNSSEYISPKQLMLEEKFSEDSEGNIIYETAVNSLDEIAAWVLSRGKGVIVLEPQELIDKVLELANQTIENYTLDLDLIIGNSS